jgi:hypothetical protein
LRGAGNKAEYCLTVAFRIRRIAEKFASEEEKHGESILKTCAELEQN